MASLNARAFLNSVTTRSWSIPIVILYVTEGCNLQCVMCSYRQPSPDELSLEEISGLARRLKAKGLQRIVYSGGEPLVRSDFPHICREFARAGIQQSLLTNGLLLEKRYDEIADFIDDYIVSIDGPTSSVHDSIRGVQCFHQVVRGITKVVSQGRTNRVLARYVVQKRNYRCVDEMVHFAKSVGLQQVSYLAVDVESDAFGKQQGMPLAARNSLVLAENEAREFREIVEGMIETRRLEIEHKFIAQSPGQLLHIVQYFEARAGIASFPVNRCNAPSVSAVITSTGAVKPCFFLPAFGSIRQTPLEQLLNRDSVRETRRDVLLRKIERCKKCVCTLHVNPLKAVFNRF